MYVFGLFDFFLKKRKKRKKHSSFYHSCFLLGKSEEISIGGIILNTNTEQWFSYSHKIWLR